MAYCRAIVGEWITLPGPVFPRCGNNDITTAVERERDVDIRATVLYMD